MPITSQSPQIVLMDNVQFHKTALVKETLKEKGLYAEYVPPYSPQFNPIETVFSVLKRRARRFVDTEGALRDEALSDVINTIDYNIIRNAFIHSLRELESCI